MIEIYPAYLEEAYRIELDFDTVARIRKFDPLTGKAEDDIEEAVIYPAKHFVMPENQVHKAVSRIKEELEEQYERFLGQNKLLEAQRIKSRTEYDIEMMEEMGYCSGIENPTRPSFWAKPASGRRPHDYTPKDFVTSSTIARHLSQLGHVRRLQEPQDFPVDYITASVIQRVGQQPLKLDEFESI